MHVNGGVSALCIIPQAFFFCLSVKFWFVLPFYVLTLDALKQLIMNFPESAVLAIIIISYVYLCVNFYCKHCNSTQGPKS